MDELPPTQPALSYPIAYHSTPLYAPPPPRKRRSWRVLFVVLGPVLVIVFSVTAWFIFQPGSQMSHTPKATPTSADTPIPLYNAQPQLNGSISDFIGKYGSSIQDNSTSSFDFWADADHTIILKVTLDGKLAHMIVVTAPIAWIADHTKTYCSQFLPSDAVEYKTDGSSIYYHSNAGTVEMQFGAGSCLLFFCVV